MPLAEGHKILRENNVPSAHHETHSGTGALQNIFRCPWQIFDAVYVSTIHVQVNMEFLRVWPTWQAMIGIVFALLHFGTHVATYCIWTLQILKFNCFLTVSCSFPARRTSSEAVLSIPLMRTENGPSCGFISQLLSVRVI